MSSTESGVVKKARRAPSRAAQRAAAEVERKRSSCCISGQRMWPLLPVPRWSKPTTTKRRGRSGRSPTTLEHLVDAVETRPAAEDRHHRGVVERVGRRRSRATRSATVPGHAAAVVERHVDDNGRHDAGALDASSSLLRGLRASGDGRAEQHREHARSAAPASCP